MNKQYKQPEEVKIDDATLNQPQYFSNLQGMYETVTAAPTNSPTNALNQVKIYTNGATLRLYWFDAKNNLWHYVTATA